MRIARLLAGALLSGGFLVAAAATPAQAASGCNSWTTSSTFAYGQCTQLSYGDRWRLGIRCADGDYKWSNWWDSTPPTSLRCNAGQGRITNHWIDTANWG